VLALTVLSGLAAIPTVAALVGQQGGGTVNNDYLMRPLELSHSLAVLLVVGSVAILAVALLLIAGLVLRGRATGLWLVAAAISVGLGGALGWAYRIVTAGVIGANLGAGLLLLFGGPFVAVVLIAEVCVVVLAGKADSSPIPTRARATP
jgi:hypothetical protein